MTFCSYVQSDDVELCIDGNHMVVEFVARRGEYSMVKVLASQYLYPPDSLVLIGNWNLDNNRFWLMKDNNKKEMAIVHIEDVVATVTVKGAWGEVLTTDLALQNIAGDPSDEEE